MSNSRKKTPFAGVTTIESDKWFKQTEHRRERAALRAALSHDGEAPHSKQFGDPWKGGKDGKLYVPDEPKRLRK